MSSLNSSVSACRHCLHYQVEGRRGGTCEQLGVPVQAQWRACPLAAPLFTTNRLDPVDVAVHPSAIAPLIEVVPVVATSEIPTPAEVIPITGITRRSALRSPSLMA